MDGQSNVCEAEGVPEDYRSMPGSQQPIDRHKLSLHSYKLARSLSSVASGYDENCWMPTNNRKKDRKNNMQQSHTRIDSSYCSMAPCVGVLARSLSTRSKLHNANLSKFASKRSRPFSFGRATSTRLFLWKKSLGQDNHLETATLQ